jgi:hypothetical protein
MLNYVSRERAILVFRAAPPEGDQKRVRIGVIQLKKFKVRIIPDATEEEIQELNKFAADLRLADKDRKDAILVFPQLVGQVVEYFGKKATATDKQLIKATVRTALRGTRGEDEAAKRPEKQPTPPPAGAPTPEAVAEILHKLLVENVAGRVTGGAGSGKKTSIFGSCDLVSVARGLLAAGG